MDVVSVAFLVGFFGDLFLQILCKSTSFDYGLRDYFTQHNGPEALFIAGGMMALFMIIYNLTGLPLKWQYLAVYGVILDLLFRTFNIFPSLEGYYSSLNHFWSGLWQSVSMVLILVAYRLIN